MNGWTAGKRRGIPDNRERRNERMNSVNSSITHINARSPTGHGTWVIGHGRREVHAEGQIDVDVSAPNSDTKAYPKLSGPFHFTRQNMATCAAQQHN